MEEEQKEKVKVKVKVTRLLITIAIVLVTALVVGGVTWYYMDKSAKDLKEANDKEVQALEKQITILKKTETAEVKSKANTTSDWHTYKNNDYNFQLTLGDKFKGYIVNKDSNNGIDSYLFSLPTTDSQYVSVNNNPAPVFRITIYTDAKYQELMNQEGPKPTFIKSSNGKTYAYWLATQWPSDWGLTGGENGDIKTVVDTLKIN